LKEKLTTDGKQKVIKTIGEKRKDHPKIVPTTIKEGGNANSK
jgi:hypothetical protein